MDFWDKPKAPEIRKLIPMTNGIFSQMTYQWREEITASQLDFLFLSKFGRRNPSPVVDLVIDKFELDYDHVLTQAALKDLADLLLMTFKPKWDKLSEIYDVEYDPIHNYLDQWEEEGEKENSRTDVNVQNRTDTLNTRVDRTNTRTDNLTETTDRDVDSESTRTDNLTELETRDLDSSSLRTDNLSEQKTYNSTDTRTDNLEQHDSGSMGSREHLMQGLNSTTYQPADKDVFSGDNSNTRTNTGTQTNAKTGTDTIGNSGTQTVTGEDNGTVTTTDTGTQETDGTIAEDITVHNTGTVGNVGADVTTGSNSRVTRDDLTSDGSESTNRSGRHFGNIGNLTSQKQLKEEIELWKWNFVNEILEDAKQLLCLEVYLNY